MTTDKDIIFKKLQEFIRKYYINQLLRGSILFIGIGLLYLLFTSLIEYFLWLPPIGRSFLFWSFVLVETFLLFKFIIFTLFKLFKLQKGINYIEASAIIGKHFRLVNDKLLNFLQLSNDPLPTELVLASIQQKANTLRPINFTQAIDFSKNKKFIPLVFIPIIVFLFFVIAGKQQYITDSLSRVVHYKKEYLAPAPFSFKILSKLYTQQNKQYQLLVATTGKIVPEKALLFIGAESYYLENVSPGVFKYTFDNINQSIKFHLQANTVVSPDYFLEVASVPAIANLEMQLKYPLYLHKATQIIKGTGNAIVPEGTQISWKISTIATNKVQYTSPLEQKTFSGSKNNYFFTKNMVQSTEYQIITSNAKVNNYEKLTYSVQVIKDQYPSIQIAPIPDSLQTSKKYILGKLSDDYGLSNLSIVYYPKNNSRITYRANIPINHTVYDQFVFSFPSNLKVQEGVSYGYYFIVSDNDALHNFKKTKSTVFSYRESTAQEKQEQNLLQQNTSINGLQKSLLQQEKQWKELDKITNTSKQNNDLDYKEQQKINEFIKQQKEQEKIKKEFSEKIKDNLDKLDPTNKDPKKQLLQDKLEKIEKESEKNQKLLEELQQLNQKLEQEQLFQKIEKFQQQSKNQAKSLEQLVELTKRYYVEKKAEQLANKLTQLANKQETLAKDANQNNTTKQEEIQKEFNTIQKELQALNKENNQLKKPLQIPQDKDKQDNINKDMQNALQDLMQNAKDKASKKQSSASKKMQQMSQSIQTEMQGGEKEQLEEDVKMLRQVIDNLLEFSFSQENLINKFKNSKGSTTTFAKNIKQQQDLKNQFKHVEDSLFALSIRNPKISDKVTTEIGNIHYNIDKSINYFTENQTSRGVSNQQYALTGANNLANLLSDIITSMQMSLSSMGQGKPKSGQGNSEMQLPDIIKKQEGLGKKMKNAPNGNKPENAPSNKSSDKSGNKSGNKPNGSAPNDNNNENNANQILDILKQQQQLREALEQQLLKNGLLNQGQGVLDKMKQIEKQLINQGFTKDAIQKVLNLKYELLKLDKAIQQQNQDNKREATQNQKQFNNTAPSLPLQLQEYLNSIEILNRQSLPLRSQYNKRIQHYFKNND